MTSDFVHRQSETSEINLFNLLLAASNWRTHWKATWTQKERVNLNTVSRALDQSIDPGNSTHFAISPTQAVCDYFKQLAWWLMAHFHSLVQLDLTLLALFGFLSGQRCKWCLVTGTFLVSPPWRFYVSWGDAKRWCKNTLGYWLVSDNCITASSSCEIARPEKPSIFKQHLFI